MSTAFPGDGAERSAARFIEPLDVAVTRWAAVEPFERSGGDFR
jgi:hypothetical protein